MILAIAVWFSFLIVPGWFLTSALKERQDVIEKIAYSSAISSAVLIVLFVTRTWAKWPIDVSWLLMLDATCLCLCLFGCSMIWAIRKASLPSRKWAGLFYERLIPSKPSKAQIIALVFAFTYLPIILYAYLSKFPIFSSSFLVSPDFLNTAGLVKDYALNGPPDIMRQILYYGVHYHLAFFYSLSGADPNQLLVTRQGMAVLVILSQFYIFALMKKLSKGSSSIGLAAMAFYSLSAFLWFGQVYNSGLYPNFFGLLIASPFLIMASIDFLGRNRHGVVTAFILLAAILVAAFSHYSTMLLLPLLGATGFMVARKEVPKMRRIVFLIMMLLPLAVGVLFFSSLFLGFLQGSGVHPDLSQNWLADSLKGLPVLAYSVLLMANPLGSPILLMFAVLGAVVAMRSKNRWMSLLPAWFLWLIAVSPLNDAAWRFGFLTLAPLTCLSALGFHEIAARVVSFFTVFRGTPRLTSASIFVITLITIPTVYGITTSPFVGFSGDCNPDGICYSRTDYSIYSSMKWMAKQRCYYAAQEESYEGYNNITAFHPRQCVFVSPTDPRFNSALLTTGAVASWNNSLFSSPATTIYYALKHNVSYIVVDDLPEYALPTCYSVAVALRVLNSTAAQSVKFSIGLLNLENASIYRQNATASVYVDNIKVASNELIVRGMANFTLRFPHAGTYNVKAEAGIVYSNAYTVDIGSSSKPINHPANLYECRPFFWSSSQLGGAVLAYKNEDVKIWCVRQVNNLC